LGFSGDGFPRSTFAVTATPAPLGIGLIAVDQPVLVYVDAGQQPNAAVFLSSGTISTGSSVVSVTGYLLDCNAAPCAAIASF
jgi:hypothetical protein